MPIVQVSILEGRSAEKKAGLLTAVTDAVVGVLEVPRDSVRVLLTEVPAEHWAVGGVPKSAAPGSTPQTDRSTAA
jgi:4-oxalocrotonate tautomerase